MYIWYIYIYRSLISTVLYIITPEHDLLYFYQHDSKNVDVAIGIHCDNWKTSLIVSKKSSWNGMSIHCSAQIGKFIQKKQGPLLIIIEKHITIRRNTNSFPLKIIFLLLPPNSNHWLTLKLLRLHFVFIHTEKVVNRFDWQPRMKRSNI